MDKKIEKYIKDIEKYSSKVNKKLVEKLAVRLASTMAKDDSRTVSCGDRKELGRVRRNLIVSKLGYDAKKADKALEAVCQTMKKSKAKSRVTFYYLVITELKAVKKYLDL
jgi:Holliday junction resolvasome RuvABC DNA-binding subunit